MGKLQTFKDYASGYTAGLTRTTTDNGETVYRVVTRNYNGKVINTEYYKTAFLAKYALSHSTLYNWFTVRGYVDDEE